MNPENLVPIGLSTELAARSALVEAALREMHPDSAVYQTRDSYFDVETFGYDQRCRYDIKDGVEFERHYSWAGAGSQVHAEYTQAWMQVDWSDKSLEVVKLSWPVSHGTEEVHWIVADTYETATEFHVAVCEWCSAVRGEILVFQEGCWSKSAELFESIRSTTLDGLVLAPGLKEQVRGDLDRFFNARETYKSYGIPWKRGVLLVGPPGNGKTHAVKALINHMGIACLYVKSFKAEYRSEHSLIRDVFKRARDTTPCVLVLEDLDSLVNDTNRSFFLNELDGFAANEGILVLATTNHPDRLDPAIVDRPSRFDRKYHFNLPELDERAAFLAMWNAQLEAAVRLTDIGIGRAAAATDGFSFAYLKELVLSTVMAWINADEKADIDGISLAQASLLRDQMSSMDLAGQEPTAPDEDEGPRFPWMR